MRQVWSRIFILCMACMISMSGLCLAGSWAEFYRSSDGGSIYFVDTGSIKTVEWSGRKYLEALFIQDIIALPIKVQEEISVVFDIDNQKCVELQTVHIDRGYRMELERHHISEIAGNGSMMDDWHYAFLDWIGQNRPSLVNEIQTYNQSSSGGKTDVTGPRNSTPMDPAPGVDRQPGLEEEPRNTPQSNYSPAAEKQIPENAPHWGNSSYAIYTYSSDSFTWEQAEQYCENMGGHLVTITSPQEQAFIEQLNSDHRRLWIGAHRPDGTYFAWVTGEPWSYTNWDEGEPSNKGVGGYENCVVLWPRKWNDLRNDNSWEQSGFICEWDD